MIYDPIRNMFYDHNGNEKHPIEVPGPYKKTLLYTYREENILSTGTVYYHLFGIFDDFTWFNTHTWFPKRAGYMDILPYFYKGNVFEYRNNTLVFNQDNPTECRLVFRFPKRYQSPLPIEETINAMTFLTAHDKLYLLQNTMELNHAV